MNEQILPGWITESVIGKGGFGTVYKIRREDDEEGEFCSALKVIRIPHDPEEYETYSEEGYTDEDITTIFKDQLRNIVSEFKLMAKFRGVANIVDYQDHMIVEHEDGHGWDVLIRMELLKSLPVLLKEKGTLTEKEIISVGEDICRALEICAAEKIIHRDIKPQNIFMHKYGDFKLGDFGVAKVMDHTTHATKIGTYSYIAPEVYHAQPYNATADIYSLGLVLYWLLNERRLPFQPLPPAVPTAAANTEAQDRRLNGEPLPPPKNGCAELKDVVLKACAFNAADRYQTAKEFGRALSRIVIGNEDENPAVILPGSTPAEVSDRSDTEKTVPICVLPADKDTEPADEERTIPIFSIPSEKKTHEPTEEENKASAVIPVPEKEPVSVTPEETMADTDAAPDDGASPTVSTEEDSYADEATVSVFGNVRRRTDTDSERIEQPEPADAPSSSGEAQPDEAEPGEDKPDEPKPDEIKSDEPQPDEDKPKDPTPPSESKNDANSKRAKKSRKKPVILFIVIGVLIASIIAVYIANRPKEPVLLYTLYTDNATCYVCGIDDRSTRSKKFDVVIPNREFDRLVTGIGDYAFRGCTGLTSVTIPATVARIGDYAFDQCTNLTSVVIPCYLTRISDGAFRYCSNLKSITIPETVTYIGNYAFAYDSGLEKINFAGTKAQWNAVAKGYDWAKDLRISYVHCTNGTVRIHPNN